MAKGRCKATDKLVAALEKLERGITFVDVKGRQPRLDAFKGGRGKALVAVEPRVALVAVARDTGRQGKGAAVKGRRQLIHIAVVQPSKDIAHGVMLP